MPVKRSIFKLDKTKVGRVNELPDVTEKTKV